MRRVRVPPAHAAGFRVEAGDEFAVGCPEGSQVADLAAVTPETSLSAAQSLDFAGTVRPSTGDTLHGERGGPLLTIRADDCGHNDLLFAPCAGWLLGPPRFADRSAGCRENLSLALDADVTDTLNCFMRVDVADDGAVTVHESPAAPGDRVRFRAERSQRVGVAACATENPESRINGGELGPVAVHVPEGVAVDVVSALD